MACLTIYKDNDVDSTAVSNLFIDEYMKDANDAQLKIYLYLLRMMNAQLATSVSDIADKFNHTEKDVVRSLKYWEKCGLLTLDFDKDKNLVGIHIHDLNDVGKAASCRTSATSSFIPMPSVQPTAPAVRTDCQRHQLLRQHRRIRSLWRKSPFCGMMWRSRSRTRSKIF